MQNLLLDLSAGQSVSIGEYRVTLVSTTDGAAVFEIEGPGGQVVRQTMPVTEVSNHQAANSTNVSA